MSFTDQKQRIATEQECNARWEGSSPGKRFRCYLCGYKFVVDDCWRWIYDNGIDGPGNFIVCVKCDSPDVIDRWRKHNEEANQKFWWMRYDD